MIARMNTILGLPSHPLLVHGAVVLSPLAVLAVLAYVLVPAWRARFYPLLVGVVPLAMLFVALASGSGESLQANVPSTKLMHDHVQAAGLFQALSWVLTLAFLLLVLVEWNASRMGRQDAGADADPGSADAHAVVAIAVAPRAIALPLRILLVVLALGVGVQIGIVGHTGAKSVWHNQKMTKSENG